MSTDKTLADVQPGGRVRLGDALPPLPCTGYSAYSDGTEPLYTSEQMLDYARAALSAQPSPGGKDALELLARFLQEPMHDLDMEHEISLSTARDAIAFALAARQPVGVSTDTLRALADRWASDRGYTGSPVDDIRALIDEPTAARQPVESEENVAADTYWTLAEMIELHVQRAEYWKQRALSAEGQLPVDACTVGARAIHRRSKFSATSYEELDEQNQAICEWTAFDVVAAVNEERARRLPHDHPERQEMKK